MKTSAFLWIASFAAAIASTACHHEPEGPGQRAGEKVDNAARDTKDAVKDSAHDVKRDVNK